MDKQLHKKLPNSPSCLPDALTTPLRSGETSKVMRCGRCLLRFLWWSCNQGVFVGFWQLKYVGYFHPDPWENDPIWLIFFQTGWNHQLVFLVSRNCVVRIPCWPGQSTWDERWLHGCHKKLHIDLEMYLWRINLWDFNDQPKQFRCQTVSPNFLQKIHCAKGLNSSFPKKCVAETCTSNCGEKTLSSNFCLNCRCSKIAG